MRHKYISGDSSIELTHNTIWIDGQLRGFLPIQKIFLNFDMDSGPDVSFERLEKMHSLSRIQTQLLHL